MRQLKTVERYFRWARKYFARAGKYRDQVKIASDHVKLDFDHVKLAFEYVKLAAVQLGQSCDKTFDLRFICEVDTLLFSPNNHLREKLGPAW